MKNIFGKFLPLALFITIAATFQSNAQSTIWNTPSTDVQATGTTYVEADYLAHYSAAENGGFRSYGTRVVYGARRRFEIGVNAFYTKAGEAQPVELQPNVKVNLYENENYGVKFSAGAVAYLPLNRLRAAETDAFGMIYSTFSKKFKARFGPRVTTGVYGLVGRKKFGDRAGLSAAYEQPLTKKVSFVADWFSGSNRFGYAGGGLAITVSNRSALYVGYNVGNSGRGNNYLSAFYGYTF